MLFTSNYFLIAIIIFTYIFKDYVKETLYIKAEYNNIPIFNNIFFPFLTYKPFLFTSLHRTILLQIFKRNNFSTDKSTLKVCMDLTSSLRSFCTFFDRPSIPFFGNKWLQKINKIRTGK